LSVSLLLGKLIINKHPKITNPEELLFIRALFATIATILTVNKNIPKAIYYEIPPNNKQNIAVRCISASMLNIMQYSLVKYISLTFQAVSRNLTPIATVFVSFLLLKERIKLTDLLFTCISFIGVTLMVIGYGE
jgi:drug/metabolite transporter (DMT)-like permease